MTTDVHKALSFSEPIDGPDIMSRPWSVEEAYSYCEKITRAHYENFPVGSLLIPRRLRKHVCAIYAFARTADDFADEQYGGAVTESQRLDCLSRWGEMLRQAYEGSASHPVFIALSETAEKFRLPVQLFEDLVSAFMQDVTQRRYSTFEELLNYCRRSANPVGRLVLLLFHHREDEYHRRSDDICTALQLANHWQDIAVDLDKDRVYLPVEDLNRFGITVDELKQKNCSQAFSRLLRFQIDRARSLFESGKPLCGWVRGRLGLELRATWLGGSRILERIEENDYDVFRMRPVITGRDKISILAGALKKKAFR